MDPVAAKGASQPRLQEDPDEIGSAQSPKSPPAGSFGMTVQSVDTGGIHAPDSDEKVPSVHCKLSDPDVVKPESQAMVQESPLAIEPVQVPAWPSWSPETEESASQSASQEPDTVDQAPSVHVADNPPAEGVYPLAQSKAHVAPLAKLAEQVPSTALETVEVGGEAQLDRQDPEGPEYWPLLHVSCKVPVEEAVWVESQAKLQVSRWV